MYTGRLQGDDKLLQINKNDVQSRKKEQLSHELKLCQKIYLYVYIYYVLRLIQIPMIMNY